MLKIEAFTFGPFQENTYVLHEANKACSIIDPGCYSKEEKNKLSNYIDSNGLKPIGIWLTHGHIDHMLGNAYLADKYNIPITMHRADVEILRSAKVYGEQWGIYADESPEPSAFLEEGDTISLGEHIFKVLYTPGHSPGSICFYHSETEDLLGGDVLFQGSIGRTDLPRGDFKTLEQSIKTKLYTLSDNTKVYPGHGPITLIGLEKKTNPFVKA